MTGLPLLAGVTVLEYAQYVAGPLTGMLLADLGATLIKVEPPGGDAYRHLDPVEPGLSRYFAALNRGKRSVVLDLKSEEGRRQNSRLLERADIVIHNFLPKRARLFGLDWDAVRRLNPQAVLCTVSGFGPEGPLAGNPAYHLVVQAWSGLLLTGVHPWDRLPVRAGGIPVADLTAVKKPAVGALAGLFRTRFTGQGAHIETSLLAAALAVQLQDLTSLGPSADSPPAGPVGPEKLRRQARLVGRRLALNPYYRCYRARDGYLAVACLNVNQRLRFLSVLGLQDPDVENPDRLPASLSAYRRRRALVREIEGIIAGDTVGAWVEKLQSAGVPAGPVRSLEAAVADPQVLVNALVRQASGPGGRPVTLLGSLWWVDGRPNGVRTQIPELSEAGDEF